MLEQQKLRALLDRQARQLLEGRDEDMTTTAQGESGARDTAQPEGWDVFCQRAAGCRLLRDAVVFYEIASRRDQADIRETLDRTVERLLGIALAMTSEEAFRGAMRGIDVGGDDLDRAVREVREEAMRFRESGR